MSLCYKFNKARCLLATLSPEEYTAPGRICETIQQAQDALRQNAEKAMQQCLHHWFFFRRRPGALFGMFRPLPRRGNLQARRRPDRINAGHRSRGVNNG